MKRRFYVPMVVVGLVAGLAVVSTVQAKDKMNSSQPTSPVTKSESMAPQPSAYLGIGVEALSPALASQMPNMLKDGQGVIVSEVVTGSPAEKAGLETFDIVTQYDNQKVLSPEQFVKLVRHDQPGRMAKLAIIRGGVSKTVEVTLGKQAMTVGLRQHPLVGRPWRRFAFRPMTPQETASQWTSFDSMNLARVDNNRYRAEITYKNDKGEIETRKYEGTLDEIRKDVENCKDLPRYEQAHLLRAINSPNYPYGFPFIGMMPDAGVMWDLE